MLTSHSIWMLWLNQRSLRSRPAQLFYPPLPSEFHLMVFAVVPQTRHVPLVIMAIVAQSTATMAVQKPTVLLAVSPCWGPAALLRLNAPFPRPIFAPFPLQQPSIRACRFQNVLLEALDRISHIHPFRVLRLHRQSRKASRSLQVRMIYSQRRYRVWLRQHMRALR